MEDRAAWLKAARLRRGMTQEKLAAMASVNVRTVQRAEQGRKMSTEVWNDFEAALGSSPTLARRYEVKEDGFRKFISLRRLRTAKELLEPMTITSVAKLECDVEPTVEILPILKKAIEFIDSRIPNPWDRSQRKYSPSSLVERIEDEASLNGLIEELHGIGVSIFFDQTWEDIVYPVEDYEGYLCVDKDQAPEARFLLQIVISASEKDRESFPKVRDWGVKVIEVEEDDDDDVPF